MREDLGLMTDIEAVDALLPVKGLSLLDLGCGEGATARLLVERGAEVVGVEPDTRRAALNREATPPQGLTLTEGRAESLVQADDSVDGVFFFRSLHHVPIEEMSAALAEAARVVRPGGFVFVLEPAVEGQFTHLMRPFHDEGEVRASAQEALNRAAGGFASRAQYVCLQQGRYESFKAFADRFSSMTHTHLPREHIDVPEVRARFEAGRRDEGYVFDQPYVIDLFRVP